MMMGVWGVGIAAGCLVMQAYANRPGEAGPSPVRWPEESRIPRDARRPTLLLFLHPFCPCSWASVDELAEVVARCRDQVLVRAVVLQADARENKGLDRTVLALANVAGVKIWEDDGGLEARRFGVLTSGHVLLYDRQGRLLYSGGITPARGHRGDNFGRSTLLARLLGERGDRGTIPVFGCPLFEPRSVPGELRP